MGLSFGEEGKNLGMWLDSTELVLDQSAQAFRGSFLFLAFLQV